MLRYQGLPFVPEAIPIELIRRDYNDPLIGHFGITKTKELISQKYYLPSFRKDVEAYVKGCDIYLALKVVRHKHYRDLQLLPIPTYH